MFSLFTTIIFNHIFFKLLIFEQIKFINGAIDMEDVIVNQPSSSSSHVNISNSTDICSNEVDGVGETPEDKSVRSALTFLNTFILGLEKEEETKYSCLADLWNWFLNAFCFKCCSVRRENVQDEDIELINCECNIKRPLASLVSCCTNFYRVISKAKKKKLKYTFKELADEYVKEKFQDLDTNLVIEGLELLHNDYLEIQKEMIELEKKKIELGKKNLEREARKEELNEKIHIRESHSRERKLSLENRKIELERLELDKKTKQKIKQNLTDLAEKLEQSDDSQLDSEDENEKIKKKKEKKQKKKKQKKKTK